MTNDGTLDKPVDNGHARHIPVLRDEAIAHLAPVPGGLYVDGTFGAGGYSRAILEAEGEVIAIDRDVEAIAAGAALKVEFDGRLYLVNGRFGELDRHAGDLGFDQVDGVVLDLGVSSMQLDTAERGFSFRLSGPLDMRMGGDGPSAADVVNTMAQRDLARIIGLLGEERHAGRVARAICTARDEAPIETTERLAAIVERAVGRSADKIHPATRTFQGLRLYVNGELEELVDGLAAAERVLAPEGRLVVVSFHSLEDRIVKQFLADRSGRTGHGSRHQPEAVVPDPTFRLQSAKPVLPGEAERLANPRARSARLRAAIRTAAPARAETAAAIRLPALPDWPRGGRGRQ
ncbi:MAG: 16S rRNA (cytosine(1402)-N(4))-methyltransferase RsmH [Hyphomicrobiales bacterium]|nr:16S rRNA (cytosine(1402)-N(4))-methyltransferase RsmH [Hyphomicrobiales bacterium]